MLLCWPKLRKESSTTWLQNLKVYDVEASRVGVCNVRFTSISRPWIVGRAFGTGSPADRVLTLALIASPAAPLAACFRLLFKTCYMAEKVKALDPWRYRRSATSDLARPPSQWKESG